MDPFALQVGNLLVGNERGAAGLEMAMVGPTLLACEDILVCICGADLGPHIEGTVAPSWKSVLIPAGAELRFHGAARGAWAYLCVAGGIDVPLVLGSRSTCSSAAFGGLEGRALQAGDILRAGAASAGGADAGARAGRWLRLDAVPPLGSRVVARAVPGPQDDLFTKVK